MKNSEKYWLASVMCLASAVEDTFFLMAAGIGMLLIGMYWEMKEKKGYTMPHIRAVKMPHTAERKLLFEANSLLRSVHSIVERKGKDTNWEAFGKRLDESLKRQHEHMFKGGSHE